MFTTITSYAQNSILWSESFGSSGSAQKTYCATDLLGNIYIATSVNGSGLDWKVASYRPDSVLRWIYTYDGMSNSDDIVTGIVVDSLFGVYVTGTTKEQSDDMSLIALDSAGQMQWIRHYDRANDGSDISTGITESGNYIYLCGYGHMPSSANDYTILKYEKTGILFWSKHINGSANGNDYCYAVDVDQNENVYVTGEALIQGSYYVATTDMYTVKLNSSSVVQWSGYYGLKPNQNDIGTCITADANGQVYVAGQSYISATNSDLVLVKYNAATGMQRWAAKYNGAYNGIDLATAIIGSTNSVYVLGTTQTGESNSDFVTIRYKPNGGVFWMQKYDGTVNGIDEGRAILDDGDDIVVSGRSMGSKNFDITTVSYTKQTGNINWTIRYDAQYGEAEDVASLARDEMGNVVVGAYSQNGVFIFQPEAVKINQTVKNDQAIRNHLEMLGFGVLSIVNDTNSKRIYYDLVSLVVDSFYQVGLSRYLFHCDDQNAPTRSLIHSALIAKFGWRADFDWENILNTRMYIGLKKRPAMIYTPNFELFDRNRIVTTTTNIAVSYDDVDFPILSLPNYTALNEADFLVSPSFVLIVQPLPWLYSKVPVLRYCFASHGIDHCSTCGAQLPADGLSPFVPPCNVGVQNHEIGIRIGYDYNSDCEAIPNQEYCLQVMNLDQSAPSYPQFAMLRSLPGYTYYERLGEGSYQTIRKMQTPPIFDVSTSTYWGAMTLCNTNNFDFNDYHGAGASAYTESHALGWGGVYSISRPGANQRPVYFVLPFTTFLRYDFGPDMNIYYGTNPTSNICPDGSQEIQENYFFGRCLLCSSTEQVFGLSQNQAADLLATTDYQTISSYWLDNAITVGFNDNGNLVHPQNHVTFYASNNPAVCSPASYYFPLSLPSPVCSLDLLSTGEYEMRKDLINPGSYLPGTNFLIHVRAQFLNGEVIDECEVLTLAGSNAAANVCVEIRGGIKDFRRHL